MHTEARHFLDFVRSSYPEAFQNKTVLDVGAADINGNNRQYFVNCDYTGNDVFPAPNVTIVCKTCCLPFEDGKFDTIISSECFEHDMQYKESIKKIVDMLKPNGLFVFTCASTGRAEHGTRRSDPSSSYTAHIGNEDWANYYKNLTAEDVLEVVPCNEVFSTFAFYYNEDAKDLYFYGFKKGDQPAPPLAPYQAYKTRVTVSSSQ